MSDRVTESGAKGPDIGSSSALGTGAAASKRRRRGPSHGNPEKTPCVNCGRVPHRKCEHHLCPRCCNVVVKNCPVHIRRSDTKRGIHVASVADTPRNLTEAIDVYHNEMESIRHQYRWMYERKRMADAAELQQSIKRYKETNRWLSELLSSDTSSNMTQRNQEMAKETEKQRQKVLKRYGDLLTGKSRSLPNLELKKNSSPRVENGKCHAETDRDDESEWLYILQHTAEKPAIQLRPS